MFLRSTLRPARLAAILLGVALLADAPRLQSQAVGRTATVTGRVTDATTSRPVPGAVIVIEGTRLGATTGDDGQYRLVGVASGTATLTARRIGFAKATRQVTVADNQTQTADFALAPAASLLDQMVVTGTAGAVERRSLGNSIATISVPEAVQQSAVSDVGSLLNGRAPGAIVTSGSGVVGSGPSINIRGRSTMTLSQQPLIYVDGVRTNNDAGVGPNVNGGAVISRLNDVSPEDIERIEVIKGPAAATIYGTEASNGVIQIITKRGRTGRMEFGATIREGTSWFMNPEGRIRTNYAKDPTTGTILSWNGVKQESDRGSPIWHNGSLQTYGLRLSGGPANVRYYLAGNFDKDQGVEPNNRQGAFNGRANISVTPSEKFEVNASLGAVQTLIHLGQQYSINSPLAGAAYGTPLTASTPSRGFFGAPPEVWYFRNDNSEALSRFTGSLQLQHQPVSWFNQRLVVGLDQTSEDDRVLQNYVPPQWTRFFTPTAATGSINQRLLNVTYLSGDYGATATVPLRRSITSSTSLLAQFYRRQTNTTTINGSQFAALGVKTATGAAVITGAQDYIINTTLGYVAQEQLAWRDRLFLTGAVRVDNNSAFGEDIKWVTYPKLSASWIVSDEPFFKLPVISAFKLRAAYGAAGQQPANFAALTTYTTATGPGNTSIVTPGTLGNPNLKPERGEEFEAGFEMGLLDRVNVDFTAYHKVTKDALLQQPTPPSYGFPGARWLNIGQVSNSGLEVQVDVRALNRPRFSWDVATNFTTNRDKIDDIGGLGTVFTDLPFLASAEGHPIGALYSRRVVSASFDAAGRAINALCDAGNGGAPVSCATAPQIFIGTTTPKYTGAVSTDLRFWNRLTLHGMIDFKGGHKLLDFDALARCSLFLVCMENAAPTTFDPKYIYTVQQASGFTTVDAFIHNASFTRLREISATYDLPTRVGAYIGASRAAATVAGRNLHTWTSFPGLDPESRARPTQLLTFDESVMPTLAQVVFTLSLTF